MFMPRGHCPRVDSQPITSSSPAFGLVPDIALVGAEVDAEHVIAIEVGEDLVRVRPFLTGGIGSGPVAGALEVVGLVADRTVTVDRKNLKVPAGVARCKQILP